MNDTKERLRDLIKKKTHCEDSSCKDKSCSEKHEALKKNIDELRYMIMEIREALMAWDYNFDLTKLIVYALRELLIEKKVLTSEEILDKSKKLREVANKRSEEKTNKEYNLVEVNREVRQGDFINIKIKAIVANRDVFPVPGGTISDYVLAIGSGLLPSVEKLCLGMKIDEEKTEKVMDEKVKQEITYYIKILKIREQRKNENAEGALGSEKSNASNEQK